MYLRDINDMRKIRWGKTYLWDIYFPEAPSPFNNWFPALDVDENLATLNSYEFPGFLSSYKVPQSTSPFDIKVTFTDDINKTLSTWITGWINNEILHGDESSFYVSTLEESSKELHLVKLDEQKQPVTTYYANGTTKPNPMIYLVYPEGPINDIGNSESGLPQYSMTFIVAGTIS